MAVFTAEVYFRGSNTMAYREQHFPSVFTSTSHSIPLLISQSTLTPLFFHFHSTLLSLAIHSSFARSTGFFHSPTFFFHSRSTHLSLSLNPSSTLTLLFFHSHSTLPSLLLHCYSTLIPLLRHSYSTLTSLCFFSTSLQLNYSGVLCLIHRKRSAASVM